jgi:hypothetical protein
MSYPPGPYTPDPSYDPSEGQFAPPQPKKSKKGLIITLSVVGGLVALLCCGGLIAGVVIYGPFGRTTAPGAQKPAQDPITPQPSGSNFGTGDSGGGVGSGGAATARDAADKYLAAVKKKDDKAANAVTCPSLQNSTPAGAPAGLDPSQIQLKSFTYSITQDTRPTPPTTT